MKQRRNDTLFTLYALTGFNNRASWNLVTSGESWTLSSAPVSTNTWTHLATTFDGAMLRLYVNGVLVSSQAKGGSMPASSGPLTIGGNHLWAEWFKGEIDEVRVYGRALSAAEILADRDLAVG